MSYFMMITGDTPEIQGIKDIKFRFGDDAQYYIAKILKQLPADEAKKTFLVDDGTGTSHDLVLEAQEPLNLGKPFAETRLAQLLEACFQLNCKIRIWWANNDPNAYQNVERINDKKLFIEKLTFDLKNGKDANFLYEP